MSSLVHSDHIHLPQDLTKIVVRYYYSQEEPRRPLNADYLWLVNSLILIPYVGFWSASENIFSEFMLKLREKMKHLCSCSLMAPVYVGNNSYNLVIDVSRS